MKPHPVLATTRRLRRDGHAMGPRRWWTTRRSLRQLQALIDALEALRH